MTKLLDKAMFCDLVNKCIGDRTLDKASIDTGLSRNRLHRLKNGEFKVTPSEDILRILTEETSNPQNGITYSDFEQLLTVEKKNNVSDSKNPFSYERVMYSIALNSLLSYGDITLYQNQIIGKHRYDIIASIDDVKYVFEIKYVSNNRINSNELEGIKMQLISLVASSSLSENDCFVIVTNNDTLGNMLKETFTNIKSKIMLMLIDLKNEQIIYYDLLS